MRLRMRVSPMAMPAWRNQYFWIQNKSGQGGGPRKIVVHSQTLVLAAGFFQLSERSATRAHERPF
jgi:hypothetical protein